MITILNTTEALATIESEWLDLWRRDPRATPFQSPMWLLPWWRHFGSNDLRVIALRQQGRLEALAPLYVVRDEDESLGLFLGTGISDYLDVLCGTGDHAGALMAALAEIDCQLWDLQQMRAGSPLLTASPPDGWSDHLEEQDPCLVLSIEAAGHELEHLLSTHFRKKLRYYQRTLARSAPLLFEAVNGENVDAFLDDLFMLHAARWQRRGMPGMLADEVIQQFHRDVSRAMLEAGALRMVRLRAADRSVAVFYGFAHRQTVYYYLSGYDPDLEKLSPGTVIVAQAIEEAVRAGATTFDFLRGAEDYKYSWGAKERMNQRRQLVRE